MHAVYIDQSPMRRNTSNMKQIPFIQKFSFLFLLMDTDIWMQNYITFQKLHSKKISFKTINKRKKIQENGHFCLDRWINRQTKRTLPWYLFSQVFPFFEMKKSLALRVGIQIMKWNKKPIIGLGMHYVVCLISLYRILEWSLRCFIFNACAEKISSVRNIG